MNRTTTPLLSRPWGPVWLVPVLIVWPLVLGARIVSGEGAGPLPFAAGLLAISAWAALPFLGLALFDVWRPVRAFQALVVGGAVATALAWAPLYYVGAVGLAGGPVGFWAPAAYPALVSPLAGLFGMTIGAALSGP